MVWLAMMRKGGTVLFSLVVCLLSAMENWRSSHQCLQPGQGHACIEVPSFFLVFLEGIFETHGFVGLLSMTGKLFLLVECPCVATDMSNFRNILSI